MIDVTVKLQCGEVRDRQGRKPHGKARRKHDAINLPKNLSDSENEGENLSGDENNQYSPNEFHIKGTTGHKVTEENEMSCSYSKLVINENKSNVIEALIKLKAVVKKYREDLTNSHFKDKVFTDLKARSPYRNKLDEHKKNKHCERLVKREHGKKDYTISIPHLNVGKVIVKNLTPMGRTDVVRGLPKEHELDSTELYDLVNAIQDEEFMASFKKLTDDEVEQVFSMFLCEQGSQMNMHQMYSTSVQNQPIVSPDMSHIHPYGHRVLTHTPVTSPLNSDQYDSSYETGSPSSTVVTSPGSPATLFSPPRTSISLESDQELEPHLDHYKIKPMTNVVTVLATPPYSLTRCVDISPELIPPTVREKPAVMKPLGEVVPFIQMSASDRLLEFQNSTSFCIQHFSIQLVRVMMLSKAKVATEKVEEFSKSLMNILKIKLGNKAHEGDIWQLSILAHIQFLLARVSEYRSALMVRDEQNHTLLYIAAIEQYKKPLVARYIAESMFKVGFSPLEQLDENGNTILHLLAEQGDSHVHVLSEVLMACGAKSVHALNKAHQTALHIAVCTPNPHLTTVLVLLRMRASPLQQDLRGKSALHYHIEQLAPQFPRPTQDVQLIRKMLQSLVSLNNDSLMKLHTLSSDPSIPGDLIAVILEEVPKYGVKDLQIMKRFDRRSMMSPSCSN